MKFNILLPLILFVFIFTNSYAQVPSANQLLLQAYEKAKKEEKNVFIMFTASWCVWCHKMDSSMNSPLSKKYFEDNYIIVHLTINESANKKKLENPDASELHKKFKGENAGMPFWVILDKNGNLIGDSFMRKEGAALTSDGYDNIACPALKEEVDAFITVLKNTSKLKEKELLIIASEFRKNDPDNISSH